MKKLISLCLSLVLALALAVPAAAAEAGETVAVQVNGEAVTFPDAAPELKDGRTMVPMRAVLEKLGAEVSYDEAADAVKAVLGDLTLTHTIGTTAIQVEGGEELTMDVASYTQGGRTMVPLRFFSQALGYEVYWDEGANTAVVIDKAAVIAKIDESFTILNGLQAKQAESLEGNLAIDMDFSGKAKVLDSINGDQTLPFSMKMSALYGADTMNIDGSMDLSILAPVLDAANTADAGEALDEETLAQLKELLKELSFQIIYSGDTMWMQVPALMEILRLSGEELPEGDVWMKTDVGDVMSLSTMGLDASAGTMGGVLYAMVEMMDAEMPVTLYKDLAQAAEILTVLMGDDAFTKSGEDYTWELDQAKRDQLSEALGASSVEIPLSMKMTIKADGSCTVEMELTMDELTMSLSGVSSATASTVKGQLQVKNICEVTFQGESKVAASDKAPVTAPPADAAVLDIDEMAAAPLVDTGIIGGADGPTAVFVAGGDAA